MQACRFFNTPSGCKNGPSCSFSHIKGSETTPSKPQVNSEVETKTKAVCTYFSTSGFCSKGNDCKFLHQTTSQPTTVKKTSQPVCKYYNTLEGCRKGKDCPFAHPNKTTTQSPLKKEIKEFKMVVSPVPLVDIGINLTNKRFKHDLKDILKRAFENKVTRLVITGTSEVHSKLALELIESNKDSPCELYFTAGVHPHEARECNKDTIANLAKLASHPKCIAIGECGLDYDRNFSSQKDQEYWFEEQVKLAIKLKKPLFLHERAAHKSFVNILTKYKDAKACVHCFTGTAEELKTYIDLGYYIGITGCVNKEDDRGRALAKIVKLVPLNRLMVET